MAQRRAGGWELGSRGHPPLAPREREARGTLGGEAAARPWTCRTRGSLCPCHEDHVLPGNKADGNAGAVWETESCTNVSVARC